MRPLRFGVVGCGGISMFYQIPSLRRCNQVELVAVVDVDKEHARSIARRFGVPNRYTDYHDIIGEVDAALVATPNATHADITCTLLEHGVHVLCEKPMATTSADVTRMQKVAKNSGARLMAAQCLRFNANLLMLKEIVDDELIGNIREIRGSLGGPYSNGVHRTDYRRQRSLSGGGVLIDLGVHLIDLALWITGDQPENVDYYGSNGPGWEVEADAEVAIGFSGGSRASLVCSLTQSLDATLIVKGDAGWVRAPAYDPTKLFLFSDKARVCQQSGSQTIFLPNTTTQYDCQIDHFCTAVRSGEEFLVRDDEIRMSIETIEKCYGTESTARNRQR